MVKIVEQDGENIVISVEGTIQSSDYDVMTPAIEKIVEEYGQANLMLIAKDVKGETIEAMKKDARFGFGAYKNVRKLALVTNQEWLKAAIYILSPFTQTEEKVFGLDEQPKAAAWLRST